MNILVIGGSYFLGKKFIEMAADAHHITVFNRGTRPLCMEQVEELKGDRTKPEDLRQLENTACDVVVDFCAYHEGDIESICAVLGNRLKQYIFVSTVDVYKHDSQMKYGPSNAVFEDRMIAGETGEYIRGKIALEKELVKCARTYDFAFTSIRPAMIYGEGNYAPREGIYFHWIRQAGQVIHPAGATGEFQLVYVGDVAKGIMEAVGNQATENRAFNIAPEEITTYDTFVEALEKASVKGFEKIAIPVEDVVAQGIPLPFPLFKEESCLYDVADSSVLVGEYTPLVDGLRNSFLSFT